MTITCKDAEGTFFVKCNKTWPPTKADLAAMTPTLRRRVEGVLASDRFEAPTGEPMVLEATFNPAPVRPAKPQRGVRFARPAINLFSKE